MTRRLFASIFGPRIPRAELCRRPIRYLMPAVIMLIAAATLLSSYQYQYWGMTLFAPQYPNGLHVQAYLNRLEGDVEEIDRLNHYIGMRPLEEAAQLERRFSKHILIAFACMLCATIVVHSRWAVVLALPAITFPPGFLIDLHFWLNNFGQNLDPKAALSSSIKPFTPPVLGEGIIGQFRTIAWADTGFYLACAASALVIVGLFFHRLAYKPLVDARRVDRTDAGTHDKTEAGTKKEERSTAARTKVAAGLALSMALWGGASAHALLDASGNFDLQGAIAAAEPGAVIHVPPGVYRGPLTINRSVTLKANGDAVIDGGGQGDVVRITAPDVTFQGFVVRESGSSIDGENAGILSLAPRVVIADNRVEDALFGISLKASPDSIIRNNIVLSKKLDIARRGDGIRIWQSNNVLVEDNLVRETRDVVMWFSHGVTLRRNTVTDSRYGMHFMYTHDNVIEDNHLEGNSVGAFLMYSRNLTVRRNIFANNRGPSGYGLGLKDMQGVIAEDNVFLGNRVGAYFDNPPVFGGDFDTFTRNLFAYNDLGLAFQPMVKQMAFTENAFVENMQQVAIQSGGQFGGNRFAVNGRGNYWSDYRGFDLDGDGVGDMPYHAENLFESLMDREPMLRMFVYSPAQQAIDLAARAFPIMQPEPKVTDESPLMAVTPPNVPAPHRAGGGSMWIAAIGLLGTAGISLLAARPPAVVRKAGA